MLGLFDGTPLQRPVTCAYCGRPCEQCACPRNAGGEVSPPQSQHPRVRRERRRGKWCTIIADLDLSPDDLKSLSKHLRSSLGTGGGITDGELVIQGDHRDTIVSVLLAMGYKAKPAGG
ncbi:MAG: translation initiation factor [Phycisphaerales bacterium]|nr:translation initiation factor [Phycisphaerales bacterium]